jgi:hypothetical protein
VIKIPASHFPTKGYVFNHTYFWANLYCETVHLNKISFRRGDLRNNYQRCSCHLSSHHLCFRPHPIFFCLRILRDKEFLWYLFMRTTLVAFLFRTLKILCLLFALFRLRTVSNDTLFFLLLVPQSSDVDPDPVGSEIICMFGSVIESRIRIKNWFSNLKLLIIWFF